jgi:hypothetical protein
MLKRQKATVVAAPKCAICMGSMELKSVIPKAHIFSELRTYQCQGCGNLRTVEDEADLLIPESAQVAA